MMAAQWCQRIAEGNKVARDKPGPLIQLSY